LNQIYITMSSITTKFITKDNEHCYEDVNESYYKDDKFIGNVITIEMNKKNIEIICNNENELIVEIKPGSELYEHIKSLK